MTDDQEQAPVCSGCGGKVDKQQTFCPHCGGLFNETLSCFNHQSEEADGVCVICRRPYCSDCATWMGQYYLCDQHEEYEISHGKARILSSSDASAAQMAHTSLKEAGFHPLLVVRSRTSGPPLERSSTSRQTGPDLVLVPLGEVLDAEKFLTGLQAGQKVDGKIT